MLTWNGGTYSNNCLESGNIVGILVGVNLFLMVDKTGVYMGLEEVAAVKDDVDEKPRGGACEEVATVAAEELLGEKRIGSWVMISR